MPTKTMPEYVTPAQYAKRRGYKSTGIIYRLIKEGIIKTVPIAGKTLIDWDKDGDLEFDGPAVIAERTVVKNGNKVDKALLQEVKELKGLVKELSDKIR